MRQPGYHADITIIMAMYNYAIDSLFPFVTLPREKIRVGTILSNKLLRAPFVLSATSCSRARRHFDNTSEIRQLTLHLIAATATSRS